MLKGSNYYWRDVLFLSGILVRCAWQSAYSSLQNGNCACCGITALYHTVCTTMTCAMHVFNSKYMCRVQLYGKLRQQYSILVPTTNMCAPTQHVTQIFSPLTNKQAEKIDLLHSDHGTDTVREMMNILKNKNT